MSSSDISELLCLQRRAAVDEPMPSAAVRRNRIDRLIALLVDNADEFAATVNEDFGSRPPTASILYEIAGGLPDIKYIRSHVSRWMKPRTPDRALAALRLSVTVQPQPKGVVGIIGPWNFPVSLVVQPAAAALAAGNRVMIKFSEVTALTAEAFSRHCARYFAASELAVITGGADVGAEFSRQPFDHLFFTGSTAVGTQVATAAAANLVPVTLELGGKNPAVVGPGADIERVAKRILAARLVNGGQVCLCPDDAWVPSGEMGRFVDAAKAAYRRREKSLGAESPAISIVNDKQLRRIDELLSDARDKGASVISLGADLPIVGDRSRTLAPALVCGVDDSMRIAQEEIFGPVLCVHPYRSVAEIVDSLQSKPAPLAAYWYGPCGPVFDQFAQRIRCGGMTVNDFGWHAAIYKAPFGGLEVVPVFVEFEVAVPHLRPAGW